MPSLAPSALGVATDQPFWPSFIYNLSVGVRGGHGHYKALGSGHGRGSADADDRRNHWLGSLFDSLLARWQAASVWVGTRQRHALGHGNVTLWDTATGAALRTLTTNMSCFVYAVAYSPDGKNLAAVCEGIIVVWDLATALLNLTTDTLNESTLFSMAYSPDGAAQLTLLTNYTFTLNGLAYSPDGKQLASGSNGGTVTLWDPATGAGLQMLKITDTTDSGPFSIAYSPNGKQIASGNAYGVVTLWDLATGAALRSLLPINSNHSVNAASVTYSPDGKQLASFSPGGNITLWDPVTGLALLTLIDGNNAEYDITVVAYSPDGTLQISTTTTSTKPTSSNIRQSPEQDASLSTGAKVGIGLGVGIVIALGVGLLLLRRIRRRARGIAPVKRSQSRFEKSELHNSELPRTHGRAELEARGPTSELESNPPHRAELDGKVVTEGLRSDVTYRDNVPSTFSER